MGTAGSLPVCVALIDAGAHDAAAQTCPTMRKINVGVSVAPPNVVHTTPYVAKALGLFAKRCIDANIIQFEGGQSQTANVAAVQGSALVSVGDVADRPRHEGAADLGFGAAHAAGLHGVGRHQDRGGSQGQAALRDRRRRRRLQLADGPRHPAFGGSRRRGRAVHSLADRRAAAGPDRRPDRRRRAASRGRLPRPEAEADAQCAAVPRRSDAELHVQRLRRLDSTGSRATGRCCAIRSPR